jgi:hypothetical protein
MIIAPAIASCVLFLDTNGFTSPPENDNDASSSSSGSDSSGDSTPATGSCVDGGPEPPECLAKVIPADELLLWLRADEGVETTDDGRVTAWRDSTPKLRPGALGADAKQSEAAKQPRRITEANGPVLVFDGEQVLDLPAGFDDFTRGVTLFTAFWPQLQGDGWADAVFSLGHPPVQDTCARGLELSVGGYSADYRAENVVVGATGVIDGRGWDVVSFVAQGWDGATQCPSNVSCTMRHGLEVRSTDKSPPLTRAIRDGTRVGRSKYYPNQYYVGTLGELLLYARALNSDEIASVTSYLLRRWRRL